MIIYILQKSNQSLQVSLDTFFEGLNRYSPTKSAFTQARSKLSFEAFKKLNSLVCDLFYQFGSYKKWKGFRVLAVDGSTLQLPNHKSMAEKFSYHFCGPNKSAGHWMSRISYLYDVFNGLVLDAQMESFRSSDLTMCRQHLSAVKSGDLLLLDRFYASSPLMFQLIGKNIHFVVRLHEKKWKIAKEFIESKAQEQIVKIEIPAKYPDLRKDPALPRYIELRLIKKLNREGKAQVFATSLLCNKSFSAKSIKSLYKQRWTIEEAYKLIKSRLEVADFSGKTALAVQQEFYAKTLLISLCNVLSAGIKPYESKKSGTTKSKRKVIINRSYALSRVKKLLSDVLKMQIPDLISLFIKKVSTKKEYSKKGQSVPRNPKPILKYSMNYKSI